MSLALREHREHVDHGDCHGGNFLTLVAMQARFDPVLRQPPPLSKSNPGSNSEVSKHNDLNATIQTEKCLFHVSHRRKWNYRPTTRHTIRSIRNTRNIRNTTLWLFCDRPGRGPTWYIVYGPPECDATPLVGYHCKYLVHNVAPLLQIWISVLIHDHGPAPCAHMSLKHKCTQHAAIHTNYSLSNCTISNKKDFNRSSDFLVIN